MENFTVTAAEERKSTVLTPDWNGQGQKYRDFALTGIQLGDLQTLLDNQAATAGCLQIAYLSTSSMAAVQNSIRETALELRRVDNIASQTMGASMRAANRALAAIPNAFDNLSDPDTAENALAIFKQLAEEAQKVEKKFFDVAEKYTACAKQLDAAFAKGNIKRQELTEKVQQVKIDIAKADAYITQSKQAVDDYDSDLKKLAKEQKDMVDQQKDITEKAFALGMVSAVFNGASKLVKSGTEALVTLTNPGLSMGSAAAGNAMDIVRDAVDGDGNPVNGSKPTAAAGGGSSKASIDAAQQKADAEKWIETLTKELAETSEPAKKRELQKKLDDWKEAADRATLLLSDAEMAKYKGGANETGGGNSDDPSAGAWALAKEVGKRIIAHEERMSRFEERRHEMRKMMIENQAKLVQLAQQAQFEEPQLDQLIEACGALTKASSAVNSLANWWSSVRLMLEGLSDTSERVGNTNILAKLATGNTKVYFSAVNTIIAPDLENMYGTWWAVQDICEAYTEASNKVINEAAGKTMYNWTAAGPETQAMKDLLKKAVDKAAAGEPVIELPEMKRVDIMTASSAA